MRLVIDENTVTRFKLIRDLDNDSELCICRLCLHNCGYMKPYFGATRSYYHCVVGSHSPIGNFFSYKHLYTCKNFRLIDI